MGACPVWLHRALHSEGPHAWGLMHVIHHLKTVSNFTFHLGFCKWSLMRQQSMHSGTWNLDSLVTLVFLPPRDDSWLSAPCPLATRWAWPALPHQYLIVTATFHCGVATRLHHWGLACVPLLPSVSGRDLGAGVEKVWVGGTMIASHGGARWQRSLPWTFGQPLREGLWPRYWVQLPGRLQSPGKSSSESGLGLWSYGM